MTHQCGSSKNRNGLTHIRVKINRGTVRQNIKENQYIQFGYTGCTGESKSGLEEAKNRTISSNAFKIKWDSNYSIDRYWQINAISEEWYLNNKENSGRIEVLNLPNITVQGALSL